MLYGKRERYDRRRGAHFYQSYPELHGSLESSLDFVEIGVDASQVMMRWVSQGRAREPSFREELQVGEISDLQPMKSR